jgi:signal transduction histidine kinase
MGRVAMGAAINRKQPLLLVSAIVVIAALLSVSSYLFFNDAASRTLEIAAGEDRTSARIMAHDLANSLANKIGGIQQSVRIVAQSPPVHDGDLEQAKTFLATTQQTSSDLTDFYGWAGRDGRIIWTSAVDEDPSSAQFVGVDRSDRDWFAKAKDTGQGYASSVIESLDGTDRLFISYPIIDSKSGDFEGVIYAGVPLAKINSYLGSQLYSAKEASTTLMDAKGTILQTQNTDLLGLSYFSSEYQAAMAGAEKPDDGEGLQKFVRQALDSPSSGSGVADFSYAGQPASVAYSYVRIGSVNFAIVFTKVPHVIAADVAALIDQQRLASVARIAVVGSAAAFISALVIFWNRRLEKTVAERTQELAAKTGELTAANEQLKQNEKLQKEFIDVAAHELRTPITPILTSIETVERVAGPWGSEMLALSEESYRMILRNVRRLERLSSDILHVARIESGTLKLGKEKFDLNRLIGDVIADAGKSLPDSKRDVHISFEPWNREEIVVDADQTKLYEVVTNLVQNAIKFTAEGRITASTEKRDGMVIVRISDTGSGIAPEILPRLFQKFASAASSHTLGGTGLGLYVSKSIIEAHGGRIWAENNAGGKGATFSFSIPLASVK